MMQRLSSAEAYWQEFEKNDHSIEGLEASRDTDYIQSSVYASTKRIYISLKNSLLNCVPVDKNPDAETNYQELKNEMKSHIKAFQRAVSGFDISIINEKWQLEDELKTITMRWVNIDKIFWKIDNLHPENELELTYNHLDGQYKIIKEAINKKIWEGVHQEQSTPKIELPNFNGNYEHWITFKDLFVETVHKNAHISNAQKMKHLKAKLKGEAERLIQHLQISSDNYMTCWEILTARYDNRRLLFSHYANALLNQPVLNHPTAAQIKSLHDTSRECVNAISNLKIDVKSWDPLIVHILVQKLGPELIDRYMESLKSARELPTLTEFLQFLENKFTAKESTLTNHQGAQRNSQSVSNKSNSHPYNQNNRHNVQSASKNKTCFATTKKKCPKCEQDHRLFECKTFLNLAPKARLKTVEYLRLCPSCLISHENRECRSKYKCKNCRSSHNFLLCEAFAKTENSQNTNEQSPRLTSHVSNDDLNEVLLATAQIKVQSADGSFIILRALLDQGSQTTLITENAVQQLKLKRNRYSGVVTGLGAVTANRCKGEVKLRCKSIHTDFTMDFKALIMNTLTNSLPNCSFNKNGLNYIDHLKLADPQFNISRNIDLLLGADIYSDIIQEGLIRVNNNNIIAQQTHLGWVVCGKIKSFNCHVVTNNIEQVSKFWEQEEISDSATEIDPNDQCEMYYNQTTTRMPDGRYQVRLPMKPDYVTKLGASKPLAVAVFKQMEQRMKRVEELAVKYKDFMKEYEDMNHMIKSPKINENGYFMPHHGIVRPHAITTKLRVVFNASAATKSGFSLNDLMEGGPNLQADLQTLLLKWRQHKYVFTADVEKMYRFIAIHPDDQHLQKIIWRDDPKKPLSEYQLATITYGTKAAPFLAQRTLKQLASDEGDNFPIAKSIIQNNFYMDDVLFGKPTKEEAKEARDQLIKLLRAGGLNLRKWSSNEECLVKDLPDDMRSPCNFNFTETETSKTLGLGWNPKADIFMFNSPFDQEKKIQTKRDLLSDIAKIFDPLGLLSPITVKTKLLFLPSEAWRFVKSEEKPADYASRGILPTQLLRHPLWWGGPERLKNEINLGTKKFETKIETKTQTLAVQNKECNTLINNLLRENSDLSKGARILAWISRFKTNARVTTADRVTLSYITVAEIRYTYISIITEVQLQCFETEISDLKTKGKVSTSSKLLKLNPYIDDKGLLRVGERLKNSQLDNNAKFPIIVPKNNRFTQLLIQQAHKATLHGGARLTLNYLRQKYWVISGTSVVKTELRKCVKCTKYNAPKQSQLMGDLPRSRVTPSKPFYNCGVDYAGPFDIKSNKGRGVRTSKGYVAGFVCMALKNRWQLTTKLYQDFWKKWSAEYLQSLQSRSKWQKPHPNL